MSLNHINISPTSRKKATGPEKSGIQPDGGYARGRV